MCACSSKPILSCSRLQIFAWPLRAIKCFLGGRLFDITLLLIPGGVTALGLAWLGSGRLSGVDRKATVEFLLFFPWQTLGLTLAKCGHDSWVLSRGMEWKGRHIRLMPFVIRRVLPLASIISIVLLLHFPVFDAVIALVTIAVDTVSVVVANEMYAHGRIRAAAIGQFFRYPLFVVLFVIASFTCGVGKNLLFVLFMISAISRLCCLLVLRGRSEMVFDEQYPGGQMAVQQLLNYGLFKNDQLAMALVGSSTVEQGRIFVYLARFPELVSAVVVALAPMFFPKIYSTQAKGHTREIIIFLLIVASVIIVGAFGFGRFSPAGMVTDFSPFAAIAIHGLLVGPVNFKTYELLRSKNESFLMAALVRSNLFGIGLIAVATLGSVRLSSNVLWVVPAQQLVFLLISRSKHSRYLSETE